MAAIRDNSSSRACSLHEKMIVATGVKQGYSCVTKIVNTGTKQQSSSLHDSLGVVAATTLMQNTRAIAIIAVIASFFFMCSLLSITFFPLRASRLKMTFYASLQHPLHPVNTKYGK